MKKILIFNSHGGGGHISATKALELYLCQKYIVKPALIFADVLGLVGSTGENLYNFFIRHKWYRAIHAMSFFGKWYFWLIQKRNRRLIREYLEQEQPDLVISVTPFINGDILSATRSLGLPFILVPTDLDPKTFLHGVAENADYQKFYCTRAFDGKASNTVFYNAGIVKSRLIDTGFVLRPDFFESKSIPALKKEYGIRVDKPVLLLLMGAKGSIETYEFSKELAHITSPAHILICLGKNETLRSKIDGVIFPPHITKTVIGYTDRVSDLIALADIFITKSGSVSFCEGIYLHTPMILDGTSSVLKWEYVNHSFGTKYGFCQIVKNKKKLAGMVDALLSKPAELERMKKALTSIEKKEAGREIEKLIESVLS